MGLVDGVAVLESIEDPLGRAIRVNYGGTGGERTATVTDALGRQLVMGHHQGRLTYVSDWTNRIWSFGYDGAAEKQRLVSVTNPDGHITRYSYQVGPEHLYALGGAVRAEGVHFRLTDILYPYRTIDGLQRSMAFDYFTNGRAAATTDALGQTERYEYDLFRRRTAVTDPRGEVRVHVNDERAALQRLEQNDGTILQFKSSADDNLRYEKKDPYGRVTQYSYAADESIGTAANRAGQVTLERDPTGAKSHYEHSAQGTESGRSVYVPTRTTDKNGHQGVIEYCGVTDGAGCVKGKHRRTQLAAGTILEERKYFSDASPPDGILQRVTESIERGNSSRKRVTEFRYDSATSRLRPDGKTVSGTTMSGAPTAPCVPVALTISANADDAEGSRGQCISWPPTCSPTFFSNDVNPTVAQDRPGGYSSWQAMLRFETGGLLPDDAQVISAELEFHVISKTNTDNRALLVSWADGDSAWTTGDFMPTGSGDAGTVPLSSLTTGEVNTVALAAPHGKVDRVGYTGLKLNVGSLPDAPPSGANRIQIAAREHATLPAPRLLITYCGAPAAVAAAVPLEWEYDYDDLGRLESESLELGAQSATHPQGTLRIKTTFGYDDLDRVIEVQRPDESRIYTDYDEDGNPWQVRALYTNGVERDVQRVYDAANRKVSERDTKGNETHWAYDATGNVLSVTDANNHVTSYEYDAMGRRTRTVDPNGHEMFTEYDALGDVRSITTAAGTTQFQRDAMGRVTQTVSPLQNRTVLRYDGNGNVIGVLDANVTGLDRDGNDSGESVTTEYDEFNRVTKVIDAANGETRFEYDLLGNRTAVIDALNRRTTFGYNDLGQLVWIVDPLGKITTMTYDEAGQLATRTDRNGRRTSYSYDAANRLIGIDFASTGIGLDEERHYDAFGNMDWIRNASVTYTFTYDELNRPISKTDSRNGRTISWEYDKVGNIIRRTGYEGDVSTFTYDSANRLVAMHNPDYLGATYHYDGAGRLLNRAFSNGARTDYAYDGDSRLTEVKQYASSALVSTEKYCLDAVGNITAIVRGTGGTCAAPGNNWTQYVYDDLYRLTEEKQSLADGTLSPKTVLTYDPVGNITTAYGDGDGLWPPAHYSYDAGNRLISTTIGGSGGGPLSHQYDYDNEGNRIAKRDPFGVLLESYQYDDKNRLIAFQRGAETTTYTYDPFNYRIAVQRGGEQTLYHLDGEHIEAIYDGRGKPQATFLRGAVIDEIVGAYYYDAQGRKTFYAYTHDRLTSVASIADHTGARAQTYAYSPFGADRAGTGSTPNRLKYTGREQDASGLYYYRARYYDPAARRFLTQDPLGFSAGPNFYTYAGGNPVAANDPDGQFAVQVAGGIVGAVGGLAFQAGIDIVSGRLSSPSEYTAAAIGGAAGGVAATLCGAACAGAVAGAASNLTLQAAAWNGFDPRQFALSAGGGAVAGVVVGQLVPSLAQTYLTTTQRGNIGEALSEIGLRATGQTIVASPARNGVGRSTFDFLLADGSFVESKFGTGDLSTLQRRAAELVDVAVHYWPYGAVSGITASGPVAAAVYGAKP